MYDTCVKAADVSKLRNKEKHMRMLHNDNDIDTWKGIQITKNISWLKEGDGAKYKKKCRLLSDRRLLGNEKKTVYPRSLIISSSKLREENREQIETKEVTDLGQ